MANGEPKTLNLKEMLEAFIRHREVDYAEPFTCCARPREEGTSSKVWQLLANIDEVIGFVEVLPARHQRAKELLSLAWHSSGVEEMLAEAGPIPAALTTCLKSWGFSPRVTACHLSRPMPFWNCVCTA